MAEIIFVILLAGGMLGTSALAGQWWLFSVFLVFFICFGIIEAIAVKKTGKSVSQKFWALTKTNRAMAWVVWIGMLLAWLALLWHFGKGYLF